MDINLNDLSLKELKELQAQVAKAISSFEDRKKKDAIAELEEMARARGFTLGELTGRCKVRESRRQIRHLVWPWPQTTVV
jgi:DNA-binding protein H-NS